jgi:hypothetical protein
MSTDVPAAPRLVGRRIAEWDPFDLDVHRAIAAPDSAKELPRLPEYVRREHDDLMDTQLRECRR